MECFLHIHNLHHTEQRGLAGLPCTYTLSVGHMHSHIHTYACPHTHMHGTARVHRQEGGGGVGVEITKERGQIPCYSLVMYDQYGRSILY